MATPAGQRRAALPSAIGGLATVRVGRRTAKRFRGQATSAGFRRSRSQADAGVDDERAARDGIGVRAVIAEDDGKHCRVASLSPPRSMKRFRGARTAGWLRPSCGAGTRFLGIVVARRRDGRSALIPVPEFAQANAGARVQSGERLPALGLPEAGGRVGAQGISSSRMCAGSLWIRSSMARSRPSAGACARSAASSWAWILGSLKRRSRGC